jgi:UDP-GlcNAc:undecaprenyl-phosphate GlcNAc-1-phosphate transferase
VSALIILFVVSCALSLLLTPVCSRLFKRLNIVDVPDNKRKLHQRPIPRAGGIPIAMSYLGAIGILVFAFRHQTHLLTHHSNIFWLVLPAVALVFGTGLIDDVIGLKPKHKLFAELVAATWACLAGVQITAIADHAAAGWWAIPLTVVWLVACTNAINLIDGLDGLAAGVALFATLATLIAALAQHNIGLALATAPLAGSLVGFLLYNFHPASVFLGDCGSLTVGFLLGCFAVIWCQKSATLLGMAAPLIALGLPLMDVGLTISRRFLGNRPIFRADARHIHHRLVARGLRPRKAALLLYAVCGSAAVLSLVQSVLYQDVGALVVITFCCLAWFGVRALGYVEFRVAREMVTTGTFRKVLQEEICLQNLRHDLKDASSVEECWPFLRETCRDLGFHFVRLQSPSEAFEERLAEFQDLPLWRFNVSLSESCSLMLSCSYPNHKFMPIMSLIEILKGAISVISTGDQVGSHEREYASGVLTESTVAQVIL